ncbi:MULTISPECIES: succinate dehydrogenase, cytochrome b556 subunit [Anaerolinea]|uniref:succinate dehydrogenase, cytochrome b556 subunit n=1 Tax=Anaerolinea TaxID=233189 RepID=UPI0026256CDB|nr:succinate dehydrogenase, cytochrome b556 subunit [Anaerolinea thermophila]
MSSMKTTLEGYASYRGREGHWSFLLHRITGLGVVLFLAIHIVDTSFVYFAPKLYDEVLNVYRSTLFGLGEIALVFCLFFHGVNGLRIAYLDLFAPQNWTIEKTRRSTYIALIVTLVLWLPSAGIMLYKLLYHNYGLFGG